MNKFEDIAETFQWVEPEMRLELMLEYAEKLPPLPEEYHALRDAGLNMVHECQSPVFLMIELEGGAEGNGAAEDPSAVRIIGDVPESAPTARAFVSILHEAFDGATPDEIAAAPDDALHRLGVDKLLGMQRTQGLSAIYQRLRGEVARKTDEEESKG